jgi:phosphoribosylaminoimidazolecarboxamide formyltransferase/IMP cyclohydrolase
MSGERRALISVSDKTGLIPFAQGLLELSFDIVSTGGTAAALSAAGVQVTQVSDLTGFPEIMDGRVKTLHPVVHGGLLARRGPDDAVLAAHGIRLIDLLVVNLYPFEDTIRQPGCTDARAIDNIDVGGPAMLRAAAKNHARVTVVADPRDYAPVLDALRAGEPPADLKRRLAAKAFQHTSRYDAAIGAYLDPTPAASERLPQVLNMSLERLEELRYGENPHQRAALYSPHAGSGALAFRQRAGKALSFNNLVDADTAIECANAFEEPSCVIVKHANPCGAAVAANPAAAYLQAHRTDPSSAFGGVIAFNRPLDAAAAKAVIDRQVVDVVVAPAIELAALEVFERKRSTRVLELSGHGAKPGRELDVRLLDTATLVQERDRGGWRDAKLEVVTDRLPTESEMRNLRFAWTVVKYVKSNAIVYACDGRTLGIGAGQTSRVMSARIAAIKAADEGLDLAGAVMASDAFFPFRDGIDTAAAHGIGAVIQPGGSVRDEEVVRAANEHGMAMVFTGMRHFRH